MSLLIGDTTISPLLGSRDLPNPPHSQVLPIRPSPELYAGRRYLVREPRRVANCGPHLLRTSCKSGTKPVSVDRPNPAREGDGIFYTLVAPPFTPPRSHPTPVDVGRRRLCVASRRGRQCP